MSAKSPEFRLLASCSVWPPTEHRCEVIRQTALEVEWEQVLALAERHRIWGLLWASLSHAKADMPSAIRGRLSAKSDALARKNLLYAAEAMRLQALLRAADVAVVFVKGASLAQLAYGSLASRHAKDIDILVAPGQMETAIEHLERAGYMRIAPSPDMPPEIFRLFLEHDRECEFVHQQSGLQVGLHWRLANNPTLLTDLKSVAQPRFVPLSGRAGLATLESHELFAYLCLHGAAHAWSRLKWLADIGTLLAPEDEAGITQLYLAAKSLGAGYAAAQALMLCHQLFDTPLPAKLEAQFRSSLRVRVLVSIALGLMADGGTDELFDRPFGTTRVVLSSFLLGQGWRYWRAELRLRLTSFDDVMAMPLPDRFFGLYAWLRLPLWLYRRLRHFGRLPLRGHALPDKTQP